MAIDKRATAALIAYASLALSGCAALKGSVAVSEPFDGPRARVRVVMAESGILGPYRGVRAYPNSACVGKNVAGNGVVVNSPAGFEKSLNGREIGMPATAHSAAAGYRGGEFYAVADQPIALRFVRVGDRSEQVVYGVKRTTYHNNGCRRTIVLVPQAGADYEFVLGADNFCSMQATRLTQTDSGVSATPVAVQAAPECAR